MEIIKARLLKNGFITLTLVIGICCAKPSHSKAENAQVNIDLSIIEALNDYYEDDQDTSEPEPLKRRISPRVTTTKPEPRALKETALVKPPIPQNKPVIGSINALSELDRTISISGNTRRTDTEVKTDFQAALKTDPSGQTMPALPAGQIKSELIEPIPNNNSEIDDLDNTIKKTEISQPKIQDISSSNTQPESINITSTTPSQQSLQAVNITSGRNTPQPKELAKKTAKKDDTEIQNIDSFTAGNKPIEQPLESISSGTEFEISVNGTEQVAEALAVQPDVEIASLTSEDHVTLVYEPGETTMNSTNTNMINEEILGILAEKSEIRMKIESFATSTDTSVNNARRIALSRALSIRSYLLENGVEPQRLNIKALGDQTNKSPKDRIDLIFINNSDKI